MRTVTWSTFLAALVLASCAQPKEEWRRIENEAFLFSVPVSFQKTESRGIDSFVEEYVAEGIEISFDYGIYSNNFDGWPTETTFEELKIDGKPARIGVVAREFQKGFPYSTQVRIELGSPFALSMFAACKSQEEVVLARKVFATIAFKQSKP